MQYKVPQQIDQEDKILGPLTFIQFIYILIGGGLILLAFSFFDFTLFLLVSIPIALLTIGFALVKVQDQPFSRFFLSFLVFLSQPKRRIWQDTAKAETKAMADDFFAPENKKQAAPVATEPVAPAAPKALAPAKPARKVPVVLAEESS